MQWVNSTEESRGVSKLADRGKEITQSEEEKENRMIKIIHRASGNCGTIKKDLTLVSLDSQERKKKGSLLKN